MPTSEPEMWLSEILLPAPLFWINTPMAWNLLIGSGPQPRIVQTPLEMRFLVTYATKLGKTTIPNCSVGIYGTPAVITLSANITSSFGEPD